MRIVFELDDGDVLALESALDRAAEQAGCAEALDVVDAVRHALAAFPPARTPRYVRTRLAQVERLIDMLEDEGWALPAEERRLVLRTLVYLADPEDLIPDDLPVLGMLDDAIMLELLLRRLREVLSAYDDFCRYCAGRGDLPEQPGARSRELQLRALRRQRLHRRMRLRLQRTEGQAQSIASAGQ